MDSCIGSRARDEVESGGDGDAVRVAVRFIRGRRSGEDDDRDRWNDGDVYVRETGNRDVAGIARARGRRGARRVSRRNAIGARGRARGDETGRRETRGAASVRGETVGDR